MAAVGPLTVLALILVVSVAAVRLAPAGSVLAAWWPPAGIAVAFLAMTPARWRPGFLVALAAMPSAAALLAGRPPGAALALGVADAPGTAVVIGVLGRRTPGRIRLHTLEDLWLLLVATVCGGAVVGVAIGLTLNVGRVRRSGPRCHRVGVAQRVRPADRAARPGRRGADRR